MVILVVMVILVSDGDIGTGSDIRSDLIMMVSATLVAQW